MNDLYNTGQYIEPLKSLLHSFMSFIPDLIGAILVFSIGWFFAVGVGKLISGTLTKLKFNTFFESESWMKTMEKADIELDISQFIGSIVRWILILVFMWWSIDILGFTQFADLMEKIVGYLPSVIQAFLIFIVAVVAADFLPKIIVATAQKSDFSHPQLTGVIGKRLIWIFAAYLILIELGIAKESLETLFKGLVYMVTIAGGLAFGLGGQDFAKELIAKMKNNLS